MHLKDVVAIREHARLRRARSAWFRLGGIVACVLLAMAIGRALSLGLWRLDEPDAGGIVLYFSPLLLYVIWALISGRKIPAIYLRRFGSTNANRMITDAFKERVGSDYRLVALDDLDIKPAHPSILLFLLSIATPLVVALGLIGISAYRSEQLLRQGNRFDAALDRELIPLFAIWYFGGCGVVASIHAWRVFRRSNLKVVDRRGVQKVSLRVLQLSGWFRGPRLMEPAVTVVRVADSEWQALVTTLLQYTENVIIDVSSPTSNLLWELQRLSLVDFRNCVIIANRESVLRWSGATDGAGEERVLYDETRALLVDRDILVYDPDHHERTQEWQENLRCALDNVTDLQRYTAKLRKAAYKKASFKPRMVSMLTTVFFYGLVLIAWTYGMRWMHDRQLIGPLIEPIVHAVNSRVAGE